MSEKCFFHPEFKPCLECNSTVCTECFPHCKKCEMRESRILELMKFVEDRKFERSGRKRNKEDPPLKLTKAEKGNDNFHWHSQCFLECDLPIPKG